MTRMPPSIGMMSRGGIAVAKVAAAFPGVERNGAIDRAALGKRVFGDEPAMKRLEAIIHPLVREDEKAFLAAQHRRKTRTRCDGCPTAFRIRAAGAL